VASRRTVPRVSAGQCPLLCRAFKGCQKFLGAAKFGRGWAILAALGKKTRGKAN
jgi:hypothetical protein